MSHHQPQTHRASLIASSLALVFAMGGGASAAGNGSSRSRGHDHSVTASAGIDVTIEMGGGRAISPLIYGLNADRTVDGPTFDRYLAVTRPALVRLGGNRWSGFNWANGASNAGNDLCNENDTYLTSSTRAGAAVKPTIDADRAAGAATIVTVPILDYFARDAPPGVPVGGACSGFSIWQNPDGSPNFGFQDLTSPMARLDANRPTGPLTDVPDPTRHRVYQNQFVAWLLHHEPRARLIYELDNEPDFWAGTHAELRPFDGQDPLSGEPQGVHPATYSELVARDLTYARMIKARAPGAEVAGPTLALYYGQVDLNGAPDAGGRNFVAYYLRRVRAAERRAHRRLIDDFDFHWYPQTPGGDSSSAAARYNREQNPRSLWDPSYVEPLPSTYHQYGAIADIPRLQTQIAAADPGMRLAITEWNYGAQGDISGGIADADALGIFGRYGVYAATSFDGAAGYLGGAYRVFRNYDGRGGRFGDTELAAHTNDRIGTSVYASTDRNRRRLVIVAINKRGSAATVAIRMRHLAGRLGSAAVYVMSASTGPAPRRAGFLGPAGRASYRYAMPAQSVSVIVTQSSR